MYSGQKFFKSGTTDHPSGNFSSLLMGLKELTGQLKLLESFLIFAQKGF